MPNPLVDHRVTAVLPKLRPGVPLPVRAYLLALAAWQTADGLATVSRRQLAADLDVDERSVTRYHAAAERLGLVARIDGGFRGTVQTVRLLCVNPWGVAARKAASAHAAARRKRQETTRRLRLRRAVMHSAEKGDSRVPPHTSKSEDALALVPRYALDEPSGHTDNPVHRDVAPDSAARAALRAYAASRGRRPIDKSALTGR